MNVKRVESLLKRNLIEGLVFNAQRTISIFFRETEISSFLELNELEKRPVRFYQKPVNVEHPISGDMITVSHVNALDYAHHPLGF